MALKRKVVFSMKRVLCALLVAGCVCICLLAGGCSDSDTSGVVSDDFFLENSDGTYTYGKLTMPDTDDRCPLVCISHGIYGSVDAGGAEELSERLAQAGIAAVRVDFNRCKTDDPDKALAENNSGKTNEYTLSDMLESNDLAIDFALKNYNIDEGRIGVYGRSLGGRVAMLMGNESTGGIDYKAMALIAPAGNEYAFIHYMGGEKKWNKILKKVRSGGVYERVGLKFTEKWFDDYYALNPSLTGDKFGDKPVMVYYNTKDTVVEPKTSLDCAHAYSNVEVYEVTTDDTHGYEMSYEHSDIKDEIMSRVVEFFEKNL